jgi:hypothetical protein
MRFLPVASRRVVGSFLRRLKFCKRLLALSIFQSGERRADY